MFRDNQQYDIRGGMMTAANGKDLNVWWSFGTFYVEQTNGTVHYGTTPVCVKGVYETGTPASVPVNDMFEICDVTIEAAADPDVTFLYRTTEGAMKHVTIAGLLSTV